MQSFRAVHGPFRQKAPGAAWNEFARAPTPTRAGREASAAWRRARRLIAWTCSKSRTLGYLLHRHSEDRVLVFTADNRTAYTVASEHLIQPVTCHIGRSEREEHTGPTRSRGGRVL